MAKRDDEDEDLNAFGQPRVEDVDIPPAEQVIGNVPMAPEYLAQGYSNENYDLKHGGGVALADTGNIAGGSEAAAATPDLVMDTDANGNPFPVALAGLSPEMRARYQQRAPGGPGDDLPASQRQSESIRISGKVPVSGPTAPVSTFGGGTGELARLGKRAEASEKANWQNITQAAEGEKQAVRAVADVQRAKADEEYRLMAEGQRKEQALQAQQAQFETDHQTEMRKAEGDYNEAIATQKAMTFDPDRFSKSQTGGAKMMSALSVALGAIGQSLIPGSRNVGLDMLNQAVEHDIQQQQEEYARAGRNIDMTGNTYARLRAKGVDHERSIAAARNAVWSQVDTGLKVVGGKYRSAEVAGNAQLAAAHVAEQVAKNKAEYDRGSNAWALQVSNSNQARRQFLAQRDDEQFNRSLQLAQLDMRGQIATARGEAEQAKAAAKDKSIEGWTGGAKNEQTYNEATRMAGSYGSLRPLFAKMQAWRKEHGAEVMDRPAVAEAQAMHSQALLEVKELAKLGVLSGQDVELVEKQIGSSPDSITTTTGAYLKRIDQVQDFLKRKTEAQMKAWGYHPTDAADPVSPLRGGDVQPD